MFTYYIGVGILLVSLTVGLIIFLMMSDQEQPLKLEEEYVYDNLTDDSKVVCTFKLTSLPSNPVTLFTFSAKNTAKGTTPATTTPQVAVVQVKNSNLVITLGTKSHTLIEDVKPDVQVTLTFNLRDNKCKSKNKPVAQNYLPDGRCKMGLGSTDTKFVILEELTVDQKKIKLDTLKKKNASN